MIIESFVQSAGLLIIQNNKILLAHPTNSAWYGTYSIPKGVIEHNETFSVTAKREVKEEIGIDIPNKYIQSKLYEIPYFDKNNKLYKKVYYYIVLLPDNYFPLIIPKGQLQLKENDWAGFLDINEAKKRILKKQIFVLDHLIH